MVFARRAFTLVELLATIAIILILCAILLPMIGAATEQARGVACQGHLRQLWQGFVLFAADHENRLPGCQNDRANPDPTTQDWLGPPHTAVFADTWTTAPQTGTLFPYMNHDYSVYLCPSLENEAPPLASGFNGGPGGGSNGRFDYVAFTTFDGCRLEHVPLTAVYKYADGTQVTVPTPIICEELPITLNGWTMEGDHSWYDCMGHQHRGGGYYASPDGSVNWFNERLDQNGAFDWYVKSPKGNDQSMGTDMTAGQFELQ